MSCCIGERREERGSSAMASWATTAASLQLPGSESSSTTSSASVTLLSEGGMGRRSMRSPEFDFNNGTLCAGDKLCRAAVDYGGKTTDTAAENAVL
jgi:hypothetical protein